MKTEQTPQVRRILRKEIEDFFVTMTTADASGWPTISEQELINSVADVMIIMGRRRRMGSAMLQTLVHELQDRVNQSM